ncbi:Envelope glycoprotein UL132 [Caenorhabditis elegans]|nr:Envelope glycoprotein UL132 [Caenorhabditis elegans]CDX47478.1 Envelope glycoprotein UL132 [Caenorhabditis elegans]|eukprot:NP_001294111.1 Uncharacterized protein CELE_Y65A5A.2 [Caenorhabditis elegans]
MFMDYDDDEISGNSTISADFRPREASKSGEKAENPYFLASTTVLPAVNHDGYVLPTDIDDIKNVEIPVETNQNSTMPTPLTHWSRWMQTASRFVDEYPNFSVLVISVLFAMLLFLICLVIAECVKSRRHHHRSVPRHHIPKSVTADLYNTSNCSHFYTKPTILLNQQEVTMQLITSDITVDCSSETA